MFKSRLWIAIGISALFLISTVYADDVVKVKKYKTTSSSVSSGKSVSSGSSVSSGRSGSSGKSVSSGKSGSSGSSGL